jgi:hypothetical protein
VAAPALTGRAELACRALVAKLPNALRGLARRPVTTGTEQNAAYGDPPITVACGVAAATYPPTDAVFGLDAVCWHAARAAGGAVWTTVDRQVPVRVTVPDAYQGQLLVELAPPVIAAVPSLPAARIPNGCTR